MTAPERCPATYRDRGWMAFIAGSDRSDGNVIRCRLKAGHEGNHRGSYQPFPGFADEYREWTEVQS